MRAAPVREGGRIVRWVASCTEIDDRKRAEDVLARSEAWYRSTFEHAAAGSAHIAPDGRFLAVNDRFCAIAGYAREELLAGSFQRIMHPGDLAADEENAAALLAGRINHHGMAKRCVRKDGTLF